MDTHVVSLCEGCASPVGEWASDVTACACCQQDEETFFSVPSSEMCIFDWVQQLVCVLN